MLVTEGIAHAAAAGSLLAAAGLRRVPPAEGFAPELELLTGAFAPRGRRSRVPRGIRWRCCGRRSRRRSRRTLRGSLRYNVRVIAVA
jgi:hypothetical protein